MKILVTGAAGFLGSRLIRSLLSSDELPNVSRVVAADLIACQVEDRRIESRTGTITDEEFIASIVDPDVDLVFHLAAALSGQSEAEFDVGMGINVDATRGLLEACRRLSKAPRFVFASSVAVFGGTLPDVVPEDTALVPQSSVRDGEGNRRTDGERLLEEGLPRRHCLPSADGGDPSGETEFGAVIVCQRHRP